ncbi:hypothetical protein SAMN05428988_3084 [Chitinophaga sp. YR573]|uniref:SRPBCC family protein n=1 Tax=Chitinophaga sp. YR573 TaxID=1881040 RepID=UPI0008CC83F4|nr:SRPBCC family protein [Chitinophaga sp. YR573]SEW20365.1 hypothetical protein SAMN05428988_3084 [Chitinophaga sp. YR573]
MNILLIIVLLIVLVFIIGLFSKKSYAIQRDIIVDKPKQDVFNYLKFLKNQDHYSKWVMTDPNMKKTFTGTDGTVGFIYAWNGNKKAGEGEQEITNIVEGEKLDIEVRFVRPFAGLAQTPFTTTALSPHQTKVTWGASSTLKYPMNLMLLFMNMEKMLGKDIEISLVNMKNILEEGVITSL